MNVAKSLKICTLEEFEKLPKEDGWNYELLDGVVMISPSPSREHQEISSNLHFSLRSQLKDTKCRSLYEMDIKFNNNIYKPDMMVFCDKDAELPEIVFEILSPKQKALCATNTESLCPYMLPTYKDKPSAICYKRPEQPYCSIFWRYHQIKLNIEVVLCLKI